MRDYHINVFYSEADKCYIADIPDLYPCSAHGERQMKPCEVLIAKKLWLEVARDNDYPIPEPRYRPAIYAAHTIVV